MYSVSWVQILDETVCKLLCTNAHETNTSFLGADGKRESKGYVLLAQPDDDVDFSQRYLNQLPVRLDYQQAHVTWQLF